MIVALSPLHPGGLPPLPEIFYLLCLRFSPSFSALQWAGGGRFFELPVRRCSNHHDGLRHLCIVIMWQEQLRRRLVDCRTAPRVKHMGAGETVYDHHVQGKGWEERSPSHQPCMTANVSDQRNRNSYCGISVCASFICPKDKTTSIYDRPTPQSRDDTRAWLALTHTVWFRLRCHIADPLGKRFRELLHLYSCVTRGRFHAFRTPASWYTAKGRRSDPCRTQRSRNTATASSGAEFQCGQYPSFLLNNRPAVGNPSAPRMFPDGSGR